MKLFGLIGEKLGHSLSPEIHNKVFKDNNIDGLYNLFFCKKIFENNIVESLKMLRVKGANVTIPYKEKVMDQLRILFHLRPKL